MYFWSVLAAGRAVIMLLRLHPFTAIARVYIGSFHSLTSRSTTNNAVSVVDRFKFSNGRMLPLKHS